MTASAPTICSSCKSPFSRASRKTKSSARVSILEVMLTIADSIRAMQTQLRSDRFLVTTATKFGSHLFSPHRAAFIRSSTNRRSGTTQTEQKFRVRFRFLQPGDEHFHGLDWAESLHRAPQAVNALQLLGMVNKFLFARAGPVDVDRRENAALNQA